MTRSVKLELADHWVVAPLSPDCRNNTRLVFTVPLWKNLEFTSGKTLALAEKAPSFRKRTIKRLKSSKSESHCISFKTPVKFTEKVNNGEIACKLSKPVG